MLVLAWGLGALEAVRLGAADLALRLILLAAIADGIDGALARRLGTAGPMGKQLDSLSDIVAFGVAPAFLFSTYYDGDSALARFGVAFVFVAAGWYRLARFHADPHDEAFCGLPITVAGALLAATMAGPLQPSMLESAVVAVTLAVLMVSRHRFSTLTRWRWRLLPALLAALVAIALWPRVETPAIVAAVALSIYMLWGLVSQVVHQGAQERAEEVPEDVAS